MIRLLGATWRTSVRGQEHLQARQASGKAPVISFWHEEIVTMAWFVRHCLLPAGHRVTVFASFSKDGELGAILARSWKADIVRGSASRGGVQGLRNLYRMIRQGSSPIVIPDGPRGPVHRAKAGSIVLAQTAQVPILPMGIKVERAWRLRTWDRVLVPKPFSRVEFRIGQPITVPEKLSPEAQDERLRDLERVLTELLEAPRPADDPEPAARIGADA